MVYNNKYDTLTISLHFNAVFWNPDRVLPPLPWIWISPLVMLCRFLEFGEYKGNLYGTSVESVRDVLNGGKICVIDIEANVSLVQKEDRNLDLKWFACPPYLSCVIPGHSSSEDPRTEGIRDLCETSDSRAPQGDQAGRVHHHQLLREQTVQSEFKVFKRSSCTETKGQSCKYSTVSHCLWP